MALSELLAHKGSMYGGNKDLHVAVLKAEPVGRRLPI